MQQRWGLLDLAAADSTNEIGRVLFWYGLDFSNWYEITFSAVSKIVSLKIMVILKYYTECDQSELINFVLYCIVN